MNQVATMEKPDLPLRQVKSVRDLVVNRAAKKAMSEVAAQHMNPDRMMRIVTNAMRTTRDLDKCEPMSLLGALMTCASLGLEPNTPLGHCYLIPFKNNKKGVIEVQLIIGYKGFADLARRSGQVVSIHADVVYDDDVHFSHEYGSQQHLRHVPGPRKGKMLGAYCHIRLTNGEGHVYMSGDEIIGVRDRSQGWKAAVRFNKTADNPWSTHTDRMWAKTAVRRLANSGEMPLSIEFMDALRVDDERVDYRAFAMDPTSGVEGIVAGSEDDGDGGDQTGDGKDGDVIEGEATEETPTPKPEEKAKPTPKPEEKAKPEPKAEEKAKPEPKAEPQAAHEDLFNRVIADMMEGGVDSALKHHAEALARMAKDDVGADLHRRLMEEEVPAFRANEESDG